MLDLGCGAGLDSILAARRVGPTKNVIGIDRTEDVLVGTDSQNAVDPDSIAAFAAPQEAVKLKIVLAPRRAGV